MTSQRDRERTSTDAAPITGAEFLGTIAVSALAWTIIVSYLADRAGLGARPLGSVSAALLLTLGTGALVRRRTIWRPGDVTGFVIVSAAMLAYLLWLAWPSLLARGSGTDLTHHLLLVGYIERTGHVPHDRSAVEYLGEMADYTPGLHLLTIAGAAIARTDGFHAIYAVVAVAAALKFGILFLVLLRLLDGSPGRRPLAVAGVLFALLAWIYSLGSFLADSFLAQAVSELFALFTLWALLVWDERPDQRTAALFAVGGIAVFLTWPVWIGPSVLAFAVIGLLRRDLDWPARFSDATLAFGPIAAIALIHALGRASDVAIVGTSGAVTPLSSVLQHPWLFALVPAGLIVALARRRCRGLVAFTAALALQAGALWLVARASGAATPYMALKMTYLAIYPGVAFAIVLVATVWDSIAARVTSARSTVTLAVAWLAVIALALAVKRDLPSRAHLEPIVSEDLFSVAQWARQHVPIGCVDYLVGNNYTAYWLHLDGLGNPRISRRTGDDDTFDPQASMARWLVPGSPRYAIADMTKLPIEIRDDVNLLYQSGQAAVIERRGPSACPDP